MCAGFLPSQERIERTDRKIVFGSQYRVNEKKEMKEKRENVSLFSFSSRKGRRTKEMKEKRKLIFI